MFFHNLKIEGEGKVNYKKIARAVYKELKQKAKLKAEVVLVNEEEIKKLNAENRNVDKVTDVLSFPALDGIRNKILDPKDYPYELDGDRLFVGSVALCLEQAKRQADELGKDSSGTSGSGSDNSSAGNGGCNSSANPASAIFAGFAFLSVLLLIKKKVFN